MTCVSRAYGPLTRTKLMKLSKRLSRTLLVAGAFMIPAAGGGTIEGANMKSCGEQALGAIAGATGKNVGSGTARTSMSL